MLTDLGRTWATGGLDECKDSSCPELSSEAPVFGMTGGTDGPTKPDDAGLSVDIIDEVLACGVVWSVLLHVQ